MTGAALVDPDAPLEIVVEADKEKGTLTIRFGLGRNTSKSDYAIYLQGFYLASMVKTHMYRLFVQQ